MTPLHPWQRSRRAYSCLRKDVSLKLLVMMVVLVLLVGINRSSKDEAHVDRVIDGDTIVLGDGSKVRLLQINAPEKGECGYEEATKRLRALVMDRSVSLERDDRFGNADQYHRLLRYVFVDGKNVNVMLQREGLVDRMFYQGMQGKYAYQMSGVGSCAH